MTLALDTAELDLLAYPAYPASPVRPARRLYAVPDRAPQCFKRPQRTAAPKVAVLRAPAGSSSARPVRLTRRGVVVVALAVALLGGVLVWLAALSAPSAVPTPALPAAVTVHNGDTVWAIAARYAGPHDPGALASSIQRLNHLDGAGVTPGQVLRLK